MSARFLAFAAAFLMLSATAQAQNLYNDIQREFADENQLQRDFRRYQHDIATGHYLRAAADRARIQNDEANIRFDQAIVQNDLSYQRPALVPHPQYPGYYYYPTQPSQLYYYQTPPPAQGTSPAPATYVGPPGQVGQGSLGPVGAPAAGIAPVNPVTFNVGPPIRTITVLISNPAETSVPINFAVDGTAYSVPSGYTQKIVGTASSIIEFDRGELNGDGRYRLSEGAFEFRYTERGWELFKKPINPPVPSNASTSNLPRNVPPRSVASVTPATTTALSPILPDPSAVKESVPPPPVSDPSAPR